MIVAHFETLVREIFEFLNTEFIADLTDLERTSAGEYLTYRNETTAVQISLEPHDGGIVVRIVRLRDGKLPEYPIFFEQDSVLDWYDLRDVVLLRDAWLKLRGALAEPSLEPPESEMREILEPMAQALHEHCSDVLAGDFRILEKLEPIVKRRAADVDALWKKGRLSRAAVQAVNDRVIEEIQRAAKNKD